MKKRYKMTLFGNVLVSFFIIMIIGVAILPFAKSSSVMKNYDSQSLKDTTFQIYFKHNSAGILPEQSPILRYVYSETEKLESLEVINWTDYKLYIIGNCSINNSKYKSNSAAHDLAMDRASSVSLELISYGVLSENIVIKENGNLNPSNYRNADVCDIVLRKVYDEHSEYSEY